MVATFLKLRFRVLANNLSRSPWQLVGFIIGAVYGVGILVAAVIGLVFLGRTGPETAGAVIAGVGAVVTLGWILGPVLIFGLDQTLEPRSFATFPIRRRTLMIGLTAIGVTGIPGLVTAAAGLATVATWAQWPLAALAALVTVPLAVLTAVVASRAIAASVGGLGSGRRSRELTGVLIFIPVILAGPIIAFAVGGISLNLEALGTVSGVLAWTPVGAAWAIPADVAAGAWGFAALKLLIALTTLALLWLLWRRSLETTMTAPSSRASVERRAGRRSIFDRVPATATGAIFARSLVYWLRDPRYQRQLIGAPLAPLLLWFVTRDGDVATALTFNAPFVAFILGIAIYADLSYDGTAYAMQLASGARGRADRLGRTLAAGAISAPIVVLSAVLPLCFTGRWELLPATLGMGLGVLMSAYAVCAVSSAYLVVPVPGAGDSPFKRVPGTTFTQGLMFLGLWVASALLSAPTAIPGAIAVFSGDVLMSWISLAAGLIVGGALLFGGVLVGGRALDRSGPALLTRMRSMRNA